MKRKQIIQGLKNSQRIRVIVDGVGFITTVQDAIEMPFTDQRAAVWNALEVIGREKIQGYGGQSRVYDYKMIAKIVNFQINLL
jgi:hypothetical protein